MGQVINISLDKEALFNVAYNKTDKISSQAILRHSNIFNRYLPSLIYLPSTAPFCNRQQAKGAASTIFNTVAGLDSVTSRSESGRSTN